MSSPSSDDELYAAPGITRSITGGLGFALSWLAISWANMKPEEMLKWINESKEDLGFSDPSKDMPEEVLAAFLASCEEAAGWVGEAIMARTDQESSDFN